MKHALLFCAGLLLCTAATARQTGRIHRTEVVPYDTRHDAESRVRARSGHSIDFRPEVRLTTDGPLRAIVGQTIEIPYAWTDGCTYLHLENPQSACQLWVNDRQMAEIADALTPAEFDLTDCIRQGANDFKIVLLNGRDSLDARGALHGKPFDGSYLYYQEKRSIRDFEIALVPDTLGRDFAMLDLRIIVQNRFNYDEPVTVGYDIYSPQGKLLDFNIAETTLPGRSVDTLHFQPFIYHAYENKWQPTATKGRNAAVKNPPLYKVMLFTKRDGTYKEYMPLKIGFGRPEFAEGRFVQFGKAVELKTKRYNAVPSDEQATRTQLLAIRKQGYNTLCPDYPQPAWFYALCDELGLYVIDRANIHAPERRSDRSLGGTPSNDPTLADEYLQRVQAMYYRSRNFTCVIAYALGNPSGNGYNLYKAYEWLKSVEPARPVIYEDADGEWNSDLCKSN